MILLALLAQLASIDIIGTIGQVVQEATREDTSRVINTLLNLIAAPATLAVLILTRRLRKALGEPDDTGEAAPAVDQLAGLRADMNGLRSDIATNSRLLSRLIDMLDRRRDTPPILDPEQ